MESEKTPGTDGLPAEFYKVFWKDVSSTLISALNYAYETGKLSITQRRGIIKLIPKKDAEPFFITNCVCRRERSLPLLFEVSTALNYTSFVFKNNQKRL